MCMGTDVMLLRSRVLCMNGYGGLRGMAKLDDGFALHDTEDHKGCWCRAETDDIGWVHNGFWFKYD